MSRAICLACALWPPVLRLRCVPRPVHPRAAHRPLPHLGPLIPREHLAGRPDYRQRRGNLHRAGYASVALANRALTSSLDLHNPHT